MAKDEMPGTGIVKMITSYVTLVVIAAGFFIAFGAQNQKLENACEKQREISTKVNQNEKDIAAMQKDIAYIRQFVTKIWDEVKE